jgi:hypothetical protein
MSFRSDKVNAVLLALCVSLGVIDVQWERCEGQEGEAGAPFVSLDARNASLRRILEEMAQSVGQEITVNDEWAETVLTVHLDRVEVEDAVRRIIVALGNPGHVILNDSRNRRIEILIFEDVAGRRPPPPPASSPAITPVFSADPEVIPPEVPGEKGITQEEFHRLVTQSAVVDPRDVEVIPPGEPGEPGVTQAELEEMLRGREGGEPEHWP